MITLPDWKTRFQTFLSEVPFEKRSTSRLKWTNRHEQVVCMYYGVGQAEQTITQISEHFYLQESRIKHLTHQARRMYTRYHETQAKEEAIRLRRSRLAEEIHNSMK